VGKKEDLENAFFGGGPARGMNSPGRGWGSNRVKKRAKTNVMSLGGRGGQDVPPELNEKGRNSKAIRLHGVQKSRKSIGVTKSQPGRL